MSITLIKRRDLVHGMCKYNFRVKVIRKFEAKYPHGLLREFIVADERGHIQCTLNPSVELDVSTLQEGDSVELSHFLVRSPATVFWNTDSMVQLYFTNLNTIKHVEPLTDTMPIKYSEFSWLQSWLHVCITESVHVVGLIRYVQDVVYEDFITTMGVTERVPVVSFTLLDRDRRFLQCKAFGRYVQYFAAVKPTLYQNGGTYCELRFWRLYRNNGHITVHSSVDGVSDVILLMY